MADGNDAVPVAVGAVPVAGRVVSVARLGTPVVGKSL